MTKTPAAPNLVQLANTLYKESIDNFNNYIKKYQERHKGVRAALFVIESDPDLQNDPWGQIDQSLFYSNQIESLENVMDKFDRVMTKIYEENPFPEIEFIEAMRSKPTELKNLILKFKQELKDQNLYEKFIRYQDRKRLETHHWIRDVIQSTNYFMIQQDPIDIIDGKIRVYWPVLIEEYMRCSELLIQYIIEPVIQSSNTVNSDIKTYADKIQVFFKENTKLQHEVFSTILKPWLRHAIAHQKYYFEFNDDKSINQIVFFEDDKYKFSKKHVLSPMEFQDIIFNLIHFFWSIISMISNNIKNTSTHFSKLKDIDDVKRLVNLPVNDELNNLNILIDNADLISEKFNDFCNEFHHSHFPPTPFFESLILLRSLSKQIKPTRDENLLFLGSLFRISYLVIYSIVEEKLFYSFAYASNPKKDLSWLTGDDLKTKLEKFAGGKFSQLCKDFDPMNRNAIAHLSYFREKEDELFLYYIHPDLGKTVVKSMPGQLLHIMNYMDNIYDYNLKDQSLYLGISDLMLDITKLRNIDPVKTIQKIEILEVKRSHQTLANLARIYVAYSIMTKNDSFELAEQQIKISANHFNKYKKLKELYFDYSSILVLREPKMKSIDPQIKLAITRFLSLILETLSNDNISTKGNTRYYILNVLHNTLMKNRIGQYYWWQKYQSTL